MDKRKLGRSGLQIAPLMFGGNVFGWTADEATSHRMLDMFVDAGFDAIDTADVYSRWVPGHSGGESEAVIGRWFKERRGRDRVVIATKVGMDMGEGRQGLSPAWIERAVEGSLRRLGTDYIDLYQSHRDDEDTPIEQTLEAYGRLIKAGKVRAIGASNFTAERLGAALEANAGELPRYDTLQPLYNLVDRAAFEGDLQDLCVRETVAVVSYDGLAAGFLTGNYRSEADLEGKARGRTVKRYLTERNLRILGVVDEVAKRNEATPAQVSLAWLMTRPAIAAPIVSATSPAQLTEVLGAAHLTLAADDLARLDEVSAPERAPEPA
jgi:aryl-alcohol dehydrogenase-like predicted oxidoreductase